LTTTERRPVALYFTRNLIVGGAERVVVTLANNAHAVTPVVALLERRGGLLDELTVTCFAADRGRLPGRRLIAECLWLRDVVRQTRADIVCSFLMRAHVVALLTRMLLAPHMRLVLNIHEHMSDSAEFLYPRAHDRALMRWITRHLFPRADRIVVVAEVLKRDLVETFGVPPAMIDVVHNPLDVARIRAAAAEPVESVHQVVAVGRLVPLKGYDILLRATAKLRAKHAIRVVIVGEGEARASLVQLAESLGLEGVVSFAGEQANPWKYIAHGEVLALPSRTEAFPTVLGEAMALGVPVVATDVGGAREALLDGRCGVLVPPNDVDAFAAGLNELLCDPALRAKLATEGRRRVEAFDVDAAVARYESLLARVIDDRTV
jgi:glycosyltransferase involved in cell wall biosynthesis